MKDNKENDMMEDDEENNMMEDDEENDMMEDDEKTEFDISNIKLLELENILSGNLKKNISI